MARVSEVPRSATRANWLRSQHH